MTSPTLKPGIALLSPGSWERWNRYYAARGEILPALYARQLHVQPSQSYWPVPVHKSVDNGEKGEEKPKRHYVLSYWA